MHLWYKGSMMTALRRIALCTAPLFAALPLSAQWTADRHPLYDVTTPTEEQVKQAPQATKLFLGENADWRITTTDRRDLTTTSSFRVTFIDDKDGAEKDYFRFLEGWRGERVSTQLIVTADGTMKQLRVRCTPLTPVGGNGEEDDTITPDLRMVRYTLSHGVPTADIIGTESCCDTAAGVPRPVWLQIDIPRTCAHAYYEGELEILAEGCEPIRKHLLLRVNRDVLPEPKDWRIHVDFWQHPDAVARWHGVEPWSEAHLALMRPLMKRLADCGQKVITCAIIDEAWSAQTYDWFPSQIRWVKGQDGEMHYDYSVFDKWVTFMMQDIGIKDEIFCYTMVPWSMEIRYLDEASGECRSLALNHKDPSYERIWGHFLESFRKHLREKGWLEKTSIALDERPDDLIRATKDIIARYAPELKVISSVNAPSAESEDIYLVSPILQHTDSITPELLARRKARGKKTIFYTCLSPKKPNSFTFSPPAESEWLGFFAAAQHLDGYSRWAYNSWNKNPFETTDFKNWPSGDCFLVYPGNLSSIRFERLRDGFEEYEKIRLLRERAEAFLCAAPQEPRPHAQLQNMSREEYEEYCRRHEKVNAFRRKQVQEALHLLNTTLAQRFSLEHSTSDTHADDTRRSRQLIGEVSELLRTAIDYPDDDWRFYAALDAAE